MSWYNNRKSLSDMKSEDDAKRNKDSQPTLIRVANIQTRQQQIEYLAQQDTPPYGDVMAMDAWRKAHLPSGGNQFGEGSDNRVESGNFNGHGNKFGKNNIFNVGGQTIVNHGTMNFYGSDIEPLKPKR